jgi:hypothetical protein
MTECVEEQQLIFAVFERTKYQGSRLAGDSFKDLKNANQSTVRSSYVTRSLFHREVAQPGTTTKGALIGIAVADVSRIRALKADIKLNRATVKVRSICVIDRVDEGDIDGHATMGYADMQDGVSQTQIGTVRMNIRMDLANVFSEITPADENRWSGPFEVALKRAVSIWRVIFASFMPFAR